MPVATAEIPTIEASRLIKRLCTHWAHKFEVEFDEQHGVVPFDATTTARLQASAATLNARVEAADQATLERYQGVVANHLHRMARAGELVIQWQPADAA